MNSIKPAITIILRCYGRPLRTRRMLDCIQAQTMNGIELLLMGDACPHFDDMIRSRWFDVWKSDFLRKGNFVFHMNNKVGGKDWGAKVTNQAIGIARGEYTIFADNDDMIKPEHCEFYYRGIKNIGKVNNTPASFAYNRVLVNGPDGLWERVLALRNGCVGHAELIIRTDFLKTMPPHEPVYGQDWMLVDNMINIGKRTPPFYYGTNPGAFATYVVMSNHNYKEPGMEDDI